MPTPPNKCLRGSVLITAQAAADLAVSQNVPIAVFFYASNVGVKPELCYQKLNGEWIEISKPSTNPLIYDHPSAMMDSEVGAEADIINQIGVKDWNVTRLQKWASENLYGFFKPIVPTQTTGNPSNPVQVTKHNFIDVVNESLFEHFIFVDTNGDGAPEFHGK